MAASELPGWWHPDYENLTNKAAQNSNLEIV
jgi:hypothetical protein